MNAAAAVSCAGLLPDGYQQDHANTAWFFVEL
jgi:hypothetical protein